MYCYIIAIHIFDWIIQEHWKVLYPTKVFKTKTKNSGHLIRFWEVGRAKNFKIGKYFLNEICYFAKANNPIQIQTIEHTTRSPQLQSKICHQNTYILHTHTGKSKSKGNFPVTHLFALMEANMSLFNMVLLQVGALLVLFNKLLHLFWREAFSVAYEATSAPVACLGNQCIQTLQHFKSSCTMTYADL